MMNRKLLMLTLLSVMVPVSVPVSAHAQTEEKVYICTNSGREISAEEYRNINSQFIKGIITTDDTVRVTLKGPGEHRDAYREMVNSYAADFNLNGVRCKYLKQELPEATPKTSQYSYTDSCFYLTFELSPKFQTTGLPTGVSAFLVTDSLPVVGKRYPVTPLTLDPTDPIVVWSRASGEMAAVQITCFPLSSDALPSGHIPPADTDKRVILSTTDVTGSMEVTAVRRLKNRDMYRIDLRLDASATIRPDFLDGFEYPVEIKDAAIKLYLVEKTDLKPCFFAIDYAWPDNFIPQNDPRILPATQYRKR